MSAQRSGRRSVHRREQSSPYARPRKTEKSSSWFSGVMSFLNPLKIGSHEQEHQDETIEILDEIDEMQQDENPAPSASECSPPPALTPTNASPQLPFRLVESTFEDISQPQAQPNAVAGPSAPTPPQPQPESQPEPPTTPLSTEQLSDLPFDPHTPSSDQLARVAAFLEQKQGQPMNEFETAGLLACIRQAQESREVPFRFAVTPTPSREGSPSVANQQPKTLKHNPNGVYRYEGPGSARPHTRPRGRSPATPSKGKGIALDAPTATDSKRRRLGREDSGLLVPPPTLAATAAPGPVTPPERQPPPSSRGQLAQRSDPTASPTPSGLTTNGRPRISAFSPTHTAPSVPSPLRQAWTGDGSMESISAPPTPPPPPKTKAAEFMTSLIKEVTPVKKLEAILNPYQTSSPVPVVTKKPKRERHVRSGSVELEEKRETEKKDHEKKEKEMSTQAIIEATVPKGSKRSRPPANLSRSTGTSSPPPLPPLPPPPPPSPPPPRRSPRLRTVELPPITSIVTPPKATPEAIEILSDEDDSPQPTKKQKQTEVPPATVNGKRNGPASTVNGKSRDKPTPSLSRVPTLMVEEVPESTTANSSQLYIHPAEIVEPQSNPLPARPPTLPARPPTPPEDDDRTPGIVPPSKLNLGSTQGRGGFGVPWSLKSFAPKEPSKLRTSFQPPSSSPVPSPTPTPVPLPDVTMTDAQDSPKPGPAESPKPTTTSIFMATPAPAPTPTDPKADALKRDVYALPSYTFAFAESSAFDFQHAKAKEIARGKSAQELPQVKLTAFASSSQSTVASTSQPSGGFNWAAAGMKAPVKPAGESWTCGTCMLSNPPTATDKCTVCDASRPGAAPAGGFNWAAAGIKAPVKPTGQSWTCGTCMLSNPATAMEKCIVCDAPRPGSASTSQKTASSGGGFNWAAAGMKAPSESAGSSWTCGTCMLSNPATATDKCSVCDTPR